VLRVLRRHVPLTIYVVVLMTAFNFFSHGTQDLYPRFLQSQHHFAGATVAAIAIGYNVAAIIGGIGFGWLSQHMGRRNAIMLAALLALPVLPLWVLPSDPLWLGLGAFLMQFCVQGAWGVIPAHLNELSPAEIRGTFPGFTYQIGNLLAAGNATIQASIAERLGGDYRWPLMATAAIVAVVIAVMVGLGREARDVQMGQPTPREPERARPQAEGGGGRRIAAGRLTH
jgi:SHS family lactate transporter-like MFS transporter